MNTRAAQTNMTGTLLVLLIAGVCCCCCSMASSTCSVHYSQLSPSQLIENQLVYNLSQIWLTPGLSYHLENSSSSSSCDGSLFAITGNTGLLYIAQSFNVSSVEISCVTNGTVQYSVLQTHSCFAIGQSSTMSFGTIVEIHIIPDTNRAPVFIQSQYEGSVIPNTANALVQTEALLTVTSMSTEGLAMSRYDIVSGNTNNSFSIVNIIESCYSIPQLVTTKPLSPGSVFNLTLSHSPSLSYTSVFVRVSGTNVNYPLFMNTSNPVYIKEVTPIGVTVLLIQAVDLDTGVSGNVRYSLSSPHSQISINHITGDLYLTSPINYESTNHTSVTVVASDLGYPSLSAQTTITIFIVDVNKSPPLVSVTGLQSHISELTAFGTTVAEIIVTDADSSNTSVDLISIACHTCFTLMYRTTHDANGSKEFSVVVSSQLDYEQHPMGYPLTITAQDYGQPPLTSQLSIVVEVFDENEAPFFAAESGVFNATVSEGDPVGTQVIFLNAMDDDSGLNGQLVYSILSGNDHGWFVMDSTTGLISLSQPVDPLQTSMVELSVLVQDQSITPINTTATVYIAIVDIDNHVPLFSASSYAISIPESWNATTPIFSFMASDSDSRCSGAVMYSVSVAEPPLFVIDPTSGLLYINGSLDYEEYQSARVIVTARSLGDNSNIMSEATLNLTLSDVNDNAPIIDTINCPCFLLEEETATQSCYPLTVHDRDANTQYQFMILSGNHGNKFAINSSNGIVSTVEKLDHETRSEYMLEIVVSDGENLSNRVSLHIIVVDTNDSPLTYPSGAISLNISQDAERGDAVGHLAVQQGDVGYNGLVHYSFSSNTVFNVTSTFILDPLSGTLFLNGTLSVGSFYHFTLTSMDLLTGGPSTSVPVTINVGGDRNVAPRFHLRYDERRISKNLLVNTPVAVMTAADQNNVRYEIVGGSDLFNIDAGTGRITIATALSDVPVSSLTLNVSATDNGSPSLMSYTLLKFILYLPTIRVSGTQLTQNPGAGACHYEGSIIEGALPVNVSLLTLAARQSGVDVTYALVGGGYSGSFVVSGNVLMTGSEGTNGVVLDRNETEAVFLIVRAVYGNLFHFCSVTIAINDTNNHRPQFSSSAFSVEIYQPTPSGSSIYQFHTQDQDIEPNTNARYTLTDPSSVFSVGINTGRVRTLNALSVGNYTLTVLASDSLNSLLNSTAVLTVTVLGTNNVAPTVAPSLNQVMLLENHTFNSSFIASIGASDSDFGSHGNLNYCIQSGNRNGLFSTGANGEIYLVKQLDYESQPSIINMTILVYDTSPNVRTSTTSLQVHVHNVNDETPQFLTNSYLASIREDSEAGTAIVTVKAIDRDVNDVVSYSITPSDDRVNINSQTGEISLASSIDRETSFISFTVKATDQADHSSNASINVTVLRTINNRRPTFQTTNGTVVSIPESRTPDKVLLRVFAMDTDSGLNADVRYFIQSGNTNNVFSLNGVTGDITLSRPLDYETDNHTYSLTVDATDLGNIPLTTGQRWLNVTFTLTDINDNYPAFTREIYYCTISEANGGSELASSNTSCQVQAIDNDLIRNGITYEIVENAGPFTIDSSSGLIGTSNSPHIDYESNTTYLLHIVASDNGSPVLSSTALVVVAVKNINDNVPSFDPYQTAIVLPRGLPGNTVLFHAHARDLDRSNGITYILRNQVDMFRVNSSTGAVSSLEEINAIDNYTVTISAVDSDSGQGISKDFNIVYMGGDLNSLAPQFLSSNLAIVPVSYRGGVGDVVVTMETFDPDRGPDGTVQYWIVGGSGYGYFAINTQNGSISINKRLTGVTYPTLLLVIMASDLGAPPLYSLYNLTVVIVKDHKPFFTAPTYHFTVNESDRYTGHIFGHVRAAVNEQTVCSVSYQLLAVANVPFAVNSTTGVLTVTGALNERDYNFTIEAYRNDTGERSVSLVTVTIQDNVNDFRPTFPEGYSMFNIPSSFPVNRTIFRIFATDQDRGTNAELTFSISPLNTSIAIKPLSGELYFMNTPTDNSSINLTVTAHNHNLISHHQITLNIYTPNYSNELALSPTIGTVTLPEDSETGSSIYTVTASNSGYPVHYSLVNENRTFAVHPNTGVVYLTGSLDYEERQNYTLLIEVWDGGQTDPMIFTLTVLVSDVNDNRLRFVKSSHTFTVPESTPPTTVVGMLETYNGNSVAMTTANFSIVDSLESESLALFEISSMGVLIVTGTLDRETLDSHTLTIAVSSSSGEEGFHLDFTRVIIHLLDEDDNAPEFIPPLPNMVIAENVAVGHVITVISAFDPDLAENGTIRYSLTNSQSSTIPFHINATTGVLTVTGSLDYEEITSYTLNISAYNPHNATSSCNYSVSLTVSNVIDTYPNLRTPDPVSVYENEPAGTFVTNIALSNAHPVLYTLQEGNDFNHFIVEPFSGTVRTSTTLDRETVSTYNLTIRGSFNQEYYNDITLVIEISDINDNNPRPSVANLTFLVSEGAALTTETVFNLSISDPDEGINGRISSVAILDPVADQVFRIDREGRCTLKQSLDRETRDFYQFKVVITDSSTSNPLHSVSLITVIVTDINDNSPQFESPSSHITVETPVIPGEILTSVKAVDMDEGTNGAIANYSIIGGSDVFSLDPQSGDLRLVEVLNLESEYSLIIQAVDGGGRNSTMSLYIRMIPCRFNLLAFQPPAYTVAISESTPLGTVVLSPVIHQFNVSGVFRFSISTLTEYFNISTDTGDVIVQKSLDRETQDTHHLVILVQDISSTQLRLAEATVTVSLTDSNDNPPLFTGTPYAQFVSDTVQANTDIFTVTANDIDENNTIAYSILEDPSSSFAIGRNSGIVYLTQSLDPSVVETHFQIEIEATDDGEPQLSSNVTLHITVVNSNAPNFSQPLYSAVLPESTRQGVTVVMLMAEAQTDDPLLYYSIIDTMEPRFPFSINSETGLITVNDRGLDYERKSFYSFFVEAEDARSGFTSQAQVQVTVTDDNDQTPTFSQNVYEVSVEETVAIETTVFTVQATDRDTPPNAQLTYSLSSSDTFRIDPSTGGIQTVRTLDYETVTSYQFTVIARDSGETPLQGSATVRIIVININDNPPSFTALPTLSVSETATPGGSPLTFITATDPDNDEIMYSLIATQGSNNFQLSSDGRLALHPVSVSLTDERYILNISATDGVFTIYTLLTVNVEDVNNHSPVFNQSVYTASVVENSPSNTSIVTINATDLDRGINALITYSGFDETFYVNSSTGLISTTAVTIDRETNPSYNLTVVARDGGARTTTAVVVITVEDINDNSPAFTQQSFVVVIPEGNYNNEPILTVTALDPDKGANASITYRILTETNLFLINSNTGVVSVTGDLDYEMTSSYSLNVSATDGGGLVSNVATVIVNVTNVADTNPSFSETLYFVQVPEYLLSNSLVFVPNVTFSEGCTPSGYSIFGADVPFTYTANGLRTSEILYREQRDTYSFNIVVQCYFVSYVNQMLVFDTRFGSTRVHVTVTDVNEAPRIPQSQSFISQIISEATPLNTTVSIITATDNDLGANGTVRYRLATGGGDMVPFDVQDTSGVIYVADELDRETAPPFYRFTVEAYDLGSPPLSATATVFVFLQDENDSPPSFVCTGLINEEDGSCFYNVTIPESVALNSTIITLQTQDQDIVGNISFVLNSLLFNVSSVSGNGVIRTAQRLDRETSDSHQIQILASDGVFTTTAQLLITVTDVNDNAPRFSQNQYQISVNENYPIDQVFVIINATDIDEGENAIISYSVLSSPVASNISLNSSTGHVTFSVSPDYEASDRLEFHLRASDLGNKEDFATLRVNILDQNDNAPVFSRANYSASVIENRTSIDNVVFVSATDADSGSNGLIRYSIDSISQEYFQIDPVTGLIRSRRLRIDREANTTFTIAVTATDSGEDVVLSAQTTVDVTVRDINDNSPVFDQSSFSISVTEGTASNTTINEFYVSDADEGSNAVLIFDLAGDGKDNFALRSIFGGVAIVVNGQLNSEREPRYNLILTATDGGIPALKTGVALTINVLDVNEHAPEFDRPLYEYTLAENTPINTLVATVTASDLDPADRNLTYTFKGDVSDFSVHPETGAILIQDELDFERQRNYTLQLIASEPRPNPQSAVATIELIITDVNDNPPQFLCSNQSALCPNQSFSIYENAPSVAVLANLTVRDLDTVNNPNSVTFNISSGRTDTRGQTVFRIDPISGRLSVILPLDREEKDSYFITVTATDDGSLVGSAFLTVTVLDLNDNGPLGGDQHIFINLLNGIWTNTNIGHILTNDLDIVNDHQFNIALASTRQLQIDAMTGAITVSSSLSPGQYSVHVTLTDTLYNGTTITALTAIYIDISNITDATVDNTFTLLLLDISPDGFLQNQLINFNSTVTAMLLEQLDFVPRLIFLDIQASNITVNSTEVSIAATQYSTTTNSNSYIEPDLIQHVLYINKNSLEDRLALTISTEDLDLCASEPCSSHGLCSDRLQYSSLSSPIIHYTTVSYLGIYTQRRVNCSCFTGYTGLTCSETCSACVQRPLCDMVTCPTELTCKVINDKAVCVDDCDPSPCKNGGQCFRQLPGHYCACRHGYQGPNCELTTATFSGNSYALFESIPLVAEGQISLEFITNQTDGLLLFAGHYSGLIKDHIKLSLINNTIVCEMSLGGNPYRLQTNDFTVNDKYWINVALKYSTTEILLTATRYDNGYRHRQTQVLTSSHDHHFLDLTTPVILGKLLPDYLNLSTNNTSTAPYQGCVRNVHINGRILDFSDSLLHEGLSDHCLYTDRNCQPSPCNNSGLCVGEWESRSCLCSPVYAGETCDKESVTASFTGENYINYEILIRGSNVLRDKRQTSLYSTPTTSLRLIFSTAQANAVLLQLGDEQNDHVTIEIQDGRIQLRIDLGGGETLVSINIVTVNDGMFHNISVTRQGPEVILLLDNAYVSRESVNSTGDPLTDVFLDIASLVAGGSVNEAGLLSKGFQGCMYGMTLDGHDLPISGENEAFRAQSNRPVEPCPSLTAPSPPSIIAVISTTYILFTAAIVCLFVTSIAFVFLCKSSHYAYGRKKGSHSVSRRTPRFRDYPSSPSPPSSTANYRNFIRREFGLQSTNSFEPLDVSDTRRYDMRGRITVATPATPKSPSLLSESVFESANEYEIPLPSPPLAVLQEQTPPQIRPPAYPPTESEKNRDLALDPMTGMCLRESSENLSTVGDQEDGQREAGNEVQAEQEDINEFIKKRVKNANSQLVKIDYDCVETFQDEGAYEPLGSVGSLYDILEEFERVEEKTQQQPFLSSPQKPSPLLRSVQYSKPLGIIPKPPPKPPVIKPKPLIAKPKPPLVAKQDLPVAKPEDLSQLAKPKSLLSKPKTSRSPDKRRKGTAISELPEKRLHLTDGASVETSPRIQGQSQLNNLTGEGLSPLMMSHAKSSHQSIV